MGRTILPATQLINQEIDIWRNFRKTLRREDQKILDRIFTMAKFHAQAIGNAGSVYPMESILLSILIEQQKLIEELKHELDGKSKT